MSTQSSTLCGMVEWISAFGLNNVSVEQVLNCSRNRHKIITDPSCCDQGSDEFTDCLGSWWFRISAVLVRWISLSICRLHVSVIHCLLPRDIVNHFLMFVFTKISNLWMYLTFWWTEVVAISHGLSLPSLRIYFDKKQYNNTVMNDCLPDNARQPPRSTQPSTLSGMVKQVLAFGRST